MPSLLRRAAAKSIGDHLNDESVLGRRMRALREATGTTQEQLASRLGISQSALSKLESRADIHVSTVRHYFEALGATMHINATFSSENTNAFRVASAFDVDFADDDQLILPIFGVDERFPQRDVVLSIKPRYSAQILDGKKTIELRRRFPLNVPSGTIAYIYSTTPDRALVGFAEIESVTKKTVSSIWRDHRSEACIKKDDFENYFFGQEFGYALRLCRAKRFNESIELSNLRERFDFEPPQSFLYAKPLLREALRYELSELHH